MRIKHGRFGVSAMVFVEIYTFVCFFARYQTLRPGSAPSTLTIGHNFAHVNLKLLSQNPLVEFDQM